MTSQVIYPHIVKASSSEPAHLERVPRVRVAQIVMDYLAYGWSVEEMGRQHPYLNRSELHAAMAYYFDYQEEIDTLDSLGMGTGLTGENSIFTFSFFGTDALIRVEIK